MRASEFKVYDEQGKARNLSDVLGKKSILLPGYFTCRHLCHFTMKNLAARMARFNDHPHVTFLSVDQRDSWEDGAFLKKQLKGPEAKYWSFVTADEETIRAFTKKIDFSWSKEPASDTINHEAALYVMKDAEVGKKLVGYDLKEKDLDLNSPTGKYFDFKQFCSAFDPSRSRYGMIVMNVVTGSSLLFLVIFAGSFLFLRKKK